MADFDFPRTPGGSLQDLWRAVIGLLPQIAGAGVVVRDAPVGTTETPVAHGMKFAPKVGIPIATADVRVWETRRPDTKFGYFAASSAGTIHVRFVP